MALLLASSRATGEPERVRFAWVRGEGAEACSSMTQVAQNVAARLGRDPFAPDAPRSIEASIERSGDRWLVRMRVRDADGELLGQRELSSGAEACTSVDGAVALAIAMTVDPGAELLSPGAGPQGTASRGVGPPRFVVEGEAGREGGRHAGAAGMRAVWGVGLLPRPGPGVAWTAEIPRHGALALTFGALWLAENTTADGGFSFGLTSGWLGACLDIARSRRAALTSCPRLYAGSLHSVVHTVVPTQTGDHLWTAAGLELSARWTLVPPLRLELGAEGLTPLVRRTFTTLPEPRQVVFAPASVAFLGFAGVGLAVP